MSLRTKQSPSNILALIPSVRYLSWLTEISKFLKAMQYSSIFAKNTLSYWENTTVKHLNREQKSISISAGIRISSVLSYLDPFISKFTKEFEKKSQSLPVNSKEQRKICSRRSDNLKNCSNQVAQIS